MDQKIQRWLDLRMDRRPPSGWLKAVRGALGLSARQLAALAGFDSASVFRLERREVQGTVTLGYLDRAAQAMNCRLIYAIVPNDDFGSLEAILDERAKAAAEKIFSQVEHSMRLEGQGSQDSRAQPEVESLARELKQGLDPQIWSGGVGPKRTVKKT